MLWATALNLRSQTFSNSTMIAECSKFAGDLLHVVCGQVEIARCGFAGRGFHLRPGILDRPRCGQRWQRAPHRSRRCLPLRAGDCLHSHDVAVLCLSQEDERIRADVAIRPDVRTIQKIIRRGSEETALPSGSRNRTFEIQTRKAAILFYCGRCSAGFCPRTKIPRCQVSGSSPAFRP